MVSAAAPSGPFAPDQLDDSRKFRPSEAASKMTYNLVILDGKKDYLADRREINSELRETGVIPDEAVTCQIVVPSKMKLGEYLPNYEETVGTVAGREAAKELMRLLSCDFDGLVINSKRVSELFEERVLKEAGREAGNWVKSDQAIWFLKEVSGMENAEMSWKFFIPTLKAFPIGQVEAMLMVMYDGNGVLLKESSRLVAVRHTRIGRDMSYSAVRHRYTQEDAPGGSLMYEMHWNELPMVGYVIMKFSDFRKAVQLQRVRRNGKAMIEILITRPDVYETIGDGRQDEGLIPLVGAMAPDAEVSPSWYVRDRLRNYSGRYVVVMVDLRVHWSLVGPVFLTRRKTLAVRNEMHMGAWKAAYMYDDYTIVYHRAWDYGDFTPVRGEHRRSREEVRLNVTTTFCLRCAEMTPNGMHLCPGCALPVFFPNFIPNAEEKDFERCRIVPEWVRTMGQFKQEDPHRSGRSHQEELDFLFDGV